METRLDSKASGLACTRGRGLSLRWRGERGGPGCERRLVTTRLSPGNYNPAAAPAYRATSDPSKRVAWEFGPRQRTVGGGARRCGHRLGAPSPALRERRLC